MRFITYLPFRYRRHVSRWTSAICVIFMYHVISSYMRLPVDIIRYYELAKRLNVASSDGRTCKVPELNPYDASIQKYISHPSPLTCKKVQWDLTYLDQKGVLRVNETEMIQSGFSDIECSARCFDQNTGVDDDNVEYGEWVRMEKELSIGCKFVEVSCVRHILRLTVYSYHFMNVSRPATPLLYSGVASGTASGPGSGSASGPASTTPKSEPLSVIVFAIDSMSRSNMIRQMPLTYSYIRDRMNGIIFDSHTKVGDNTWVNLLAMFTGLRSVATAEFPADLSSVEDQFFDDYAPYIWSNFSRSGYYTFWSEDRPDIHTFNYGVRKGFLRRQFDYYDRPYWTTSWASFIRKRSTGFCYNTVPEHRIQFDYLRRFVTEHQREKLFAILWWQSLTHDFLNTIGLADLDTADFLKSIQPYLNRTVLFVLSDHGHRYDAIRESVIGRLEARLPFMAMVVPTWFQGQYPKAMENLQNNARYKLTTQFDVYATLAQILENGLDVMKPSASVPAYALSLFGAIPTDRTCRQARIPEEYCPCYTEVELSKDEPMVRKASALLVKRVNELLSAYQPPCAVLQLAQIVQSFASLPHQATLRDPQVSNRVASSGFYVMYRVVIRTKPGGALLEGVVKHFIDKAALTMDSDVERNNAYGNTSYCVDNSILKKYCYCIKETA